MKVYRWVGFFFEKKINTGFFLYNKWLEVSTQILNYKKCTIVIFIVYQVVIVNL